MVHTQDCDAAEDRASPELIEEVEEIEEFGELLHFTLVGYLGGLIVGIGLDGIGLSHNGWGQGLVRTLGGEAESLLEGSFVIQKAWLGSGASLAQAYGWGKLLGMIAPWIIDGGSRLIGIDVYGVEGFYIPFFYAMSDQIGANLLGFFYMRQRSSTGIRAMQAYVKSPVMVTGLGMILMVPLGLVIARILGFSPINQSLTALEVIMANLGWLPPVVGMLAERSKRDLD